MARLKHLFRAFLDRPAAAENEVYRYFVLSNLLFFSFGVLHLLFIPLFGLLGVGELALLNVGSTAVYALLLWLNQRGRYLTGILLFSLEVGLHALLVSHYIGDVGLHLALIFNLLLVAFLPRSVGLRFPLAILMGLVFVAISYSVRAGEPVYALDGDVLLALSVAVAALAALFAIYVGYFFQRVTARTEKEITAKERILDTTLQNMGQGLTMFDADWNLITYNDRYRVHFDLPTDIFTGGPRTFDDIVGATMRQDYGEEWRERLNVVRDPTRMTSIWRREFVRPSGRALDLLSIPIPEGGFVVTSTDVSEKWDVERALRESEALYESITANLPGVVFQRVLHPDGRMAYSFVSPPVRHYIGIEAEALMADPGLEFSRLHPDDLVPFREALDAAVRRREGWHLDYRVRDAEGAERWLRNISNVRTMDDGDVIWDGVLLDISEWKRAERALQHQQRVNERVLGAMDQGLQMIDLDGRTVLFNDRLLDLLKMPRDFLETRPRHEEMVRLQVERGEFDCLTPEERARIDTLDQQIRDGLAEPFIYQRTRPDGLVLEVRNLPLPEGGWVRVFTDITERRRAEEVVARARDAAEAAAQAKSTFLATMSHEIRTPMNGVIGMLDILTRTPLDRDQREMADTIRDSAFALLRIIDDILDFSKIEAGQLVLESIPLSLVDVVETVAETLGASAREKGLSMPVFVDPELPRVLGDPVRLRQVLFNLVGNAVKFTHYGHVSLRVVARPAGGGRPAELEFTVRDTGIGIARQKIDTLFDAFIQSEASTTRRFGGTGLGLSICGNLIGMMGGSIEVESELEQGSCFRVRLPLHAVEEPPAVVEGPSCDFAGLRVLVVASNADMQDNLAAYLRHWQADVALTASLEAVPSLALEAAEAGRRFDVIVIGAGWTDEARRETREAVRAHPGLQPSRFALATLERRRDGVTRENDTVEFSVHPMRRASFLTAVAVAAGRESPEVPSVIVSQLASELDVPTIPQARERGQLILVAEDNQTNQLVLLRQLNRLGLTAVVAENGRTALEIWQGEDFALLLSDCHMPEMDGFELTAAIREAEQNDGRDRLPIVAVTANALQGEAERCLNAGMDDYLAKPVELESLRQVLGRWMTLPEAETAEKPALQESSNDTDTRFAIDRPGLARLIQSDDPDFLQQMLELFWNSVRETPGQLRRHAEGRDAPRLKEVAHRAKGASASAMTTRLTALLQRMEDAAVAEDWNLVDGLVPALDEAFIAVEREIHRD